MDYMAPLALGEPSSASSDDPEPPPPKICPFCRVPLPCAFNCTLCGACGPTAASTFPASHDGKETTP